MNSNGVSAVIGCQWGDEGKGKLIDILAEKFDIIARATGGANAGHTIYINDPDNPEKPKKFVFHLVPSGMLHEKPICVIGNGVVLHLETLMHEIDVLNENNIKTEGRILISDRTHLVFDYHKIIDGLQEDKKGDKKVGTTKRGIGPSYTDKIRRNGIRVHHLLEWDKFEEMYHANLAMFKEMYGDFEYDTAAELQKHKEIIEQIRPHIIDGALYLNRALDEGKKVLIEGANGALLDIDHGTYPFVTSSNASIGGMITGTGLGPKRFENIIGIMKAYTTRVGAGPFAAELENETGDQIREAGGEYGATTGRPRRCGWYDAFLGKYAVMINNVTEINLTKLDVLTGLETLKIAVGYSHNGKKLETYPASLTIQEGVEVEYIEMPGWTEDISAITSYDELPANAKAYVEKIEELLGCPVKSIGTGVRREDMIFK